MIEWWRWMVKAKQCDRCGGFYKIDYVSDYRIAQIQHTSSRYTKSLDLCPECAEQLQNWFEEGKKKDDKT